jgi:hypothetical protein
MVAGTILIKCFIVSFLLFYLILNLNLRHYKFLDVKALDQQ